MKITLIGDAQGRICGGEAVCGTLSDEAWKLKACPVKSLEETGTEIAWPNGEMWTHDHIAQELPTTKRGAES